MSGQKVSQYELEQQRRRALAAALAERRSKYEDALGRRSELNRDIQRSISRLACKLQLFEKNAAIGGKVGAVYGELARTARGCMATLEGLANAWLPDFDTRDSDATDCPQAEQMDRETQRLWAERDRLIRQFSEAETDRLQYAEALRSYERRREACKKQLAQAGDELRRVIAAYAGIPEAAYQLSKLEAALHTFAQNTDALLSTPTPDSASRTRSAEASMGQAANKLQQELEAAVKGTVAELAAFDANRKRTEDISRRMQETRRAMQTQELDAVLHALSFTEYQEPPFYHELTATAKADYDRLLDEMEDALFDSAVSATDYYQLLHIYRTLQDGGASAEDILARSTEARALLEGALQRANYFERWYCRYLAVCQALNGLLEAQGRKPRPIREREDFPTIDELTRTEHIVSELLTKENERRYLLQTVREVMEEFGYQMQEELVFEADQSSSHLLYRSADKRTAIHASFSGEGRERRVMLEVVGIGSSKKAPENGVNAAITTADAMPEARRKELYPEQVTFCDIHPRILARLAERGVIFKKVVWNPPHENRSKEITVFEGSSQAEAAAAAVAKPSAGKKRLHKKLNRTKQEMSLRVANQPLH